MSGALREIIALFGVEVDDKALERLEGNLANVTDKLKAFGGLLFAGGIFKKVADFAGAQAAVGTELATTATRLGITTGALQGFNFAAESSGVSAEQASRSLGFLNKNLGAALEGNKGAAQAFQHLGVSVNKTYLQTHPLMEVVGDVAEGIKNLSTQEERATLAQKVFGRAGQTLLPILQQGRDGVAKYASEFRKLGSGVSQEFINKSREVHESTIRLKYAFTSLKSEVALGIFPQFKRVVDWLTEMSAKFADLARHSFTVNTALLALEAGGVLAMVISLGKLARAFGLVKGGTGGLISNLGGLLRAGPQVAVVVAIITALYLAFDDLYTLLNGGDSILGRFLEESYGLEGKQKFVDDLRNSWKQVAETIAQLKPVFAQLMSIVITASIGALPGLIAGFIVVAKVVGAAAVLLGGFVQTLYALANGKSFDEIGKIIDKTGDAVFAEGGIFGAHTGTGENNKLYTDYMKQREAFLGGGGGSAETSGLLGGPATASVRAPGVGNTAVNAPVLQNNSITVNTGSGDPKEIGKAVAGGVRDGISDPLADAKNSFLRKAG